MSGIRLKEADLRNIEIIKEKGIDINKVFKNNSQIIRHSLDFTAKYYPLKLTGE